MPLFGAHMSIAGGLHNALLAARAHACETVQLFTKSSNQWAAKVLEDEHITTFRKTLRTTAIRSTMAHDSYLINLASPDEALYRRSLEAFIIEMQRSETLRLKYLIMHPGAHMGSGEKRGLRRVARALDEAHKRCPNFKVKVLLETTAGQGTSLGYRYDHLAQILMLVNEPERLGVCFDTCHVFAAGYPIGTEKDYDDTMSRFDHEIGLKKLRAFHVNDSLKSLGSRVDRHAHIGQGHIGLEAFRLLVNDPRFRNHPMILETPKDSDMDRVNLAALRGLVRKAQTS